MTWTFWDILVILLFLGQIGVLVWIALIALQIKNGPVLAVTQRVKPLIASGKSIAAAGQQEFKENKTRYLAMADEVKSLLTMLRADKQRALHDAMPINYRSIMGAFTTAKMLRSGWRQIQRVRNPMAHPPGPGRAGKRHPVTIADRMGLVPPIVKRAAPLIRAGKVALRVRSEMRQRTGRG